MRSEKPFYFRPPDYRYSIRSDPAYGWWTGVTGDERQFLVSLNGPLVFDRAGHLVAKGDKSEYPLPPDWRHEGDISGWKVDWIRKIGFEECPIRVLRFWVPERWQGIEDMPDLLAEYFTDRETFLKRKDVRAEDALAWQNSDEFVFHCGCDYFMNRRGEAISS